MKTTRRSQLTKPQKLVNKSGSFLIEAVVAVALLSASVVGIAKLALVQSRIRHQNELRLMAELVADNQLERLRSKSASDVEAATQPLASVPQSLRVDVKSDLIDLPSAAGVHVVVRVFPNESKPEFISASPLVVRHGWLLTSKLNATKDDAESEAKP